MSKTLNDRARDLFSQVALTIRNTADGGIELSYRTYPGAETNYTLLVPSISGQREDIDFERQLSVAFIEMERYLKSKNII